ncbi:hypothetical protein HPB52_005736 [Rhipicephalus sanguineus]|uniref:ADAMTS cysteine-rich domain-containing protein n=1 Tax=Rhipicephalus sanguineus TaxID=34632 RepID=A0A9D4SN47_RHISA|nr:hypothetical protein HPB52_005736 [Rhipicephalus sanguineus]
MLHDGWPHNDCPSNGFIMSPSRGTKGETTWSPCSALVVHKMGDRTCLSNRPDGVTGLPDLEDPQSLPGQEWDAHDQCKIFLRDHDAQLYNTSLISNVCEQVICKTYNRQGYYKAGPALDGTYCGGHNVWCLDNAKGFSRDRRRCDRPKPRNTAATCRGDSVRTRLCDDSKGHECQPTCKICGEGHETASKECKRRLKPNPPPYNIRQQRLNRIQEIDNHWSCSGEEYPGLGTSAATSSSSSAGSSTRRSRSKSILRYAAVASGSSGSSSSTFSSAETASIQVLEDGLQNQQRKLQNQHSQLQNQQNIIDKLLQSQKRQQELIDKLLENCKVQQEISYNTHQQRQDLEDTSSQPGKTLPKADVQAIVDARCKIFQEAFMSNIHATMEKVVQSAIEKTAATFEQKITTLNAKIDGIAAQVNNFIAHVKKTYVTIAQFDSFSNPRQVTRKKARANSHNASRSVSPTRDRRRDIESVEDGNP